MICYLRNSWRGLVTPSLQTSVLSFLKPRIVIGESIDTTYDIRVSDFRANKYKRRNAEIDQQRLFLLFRTVLKPLASTVNVTSIIDITRLILSLLFLLSSTN